MSADAESTFLYPVLMAASPLRLYDRKLPNPRPIPRPTSTVLYRLQTLVGITGARMAKYRAGWQEVAFVWFKLVWRPHLLGVLCFEVSQSPERSYASN